MSRNRKKIMLYQFAKRYYVPKHSEFAKMRLVSKLAQSETPRMAVRGVFIRLIVTVILNRVLIVPVCERCCCRISVKYCKYGIFHLCRLCRPAAYPKSEYPACQSLLNLMHGQNHTEEPYQYMRRNPHCANTQSFRHACRHYR